MSHEQVAEVFETHVSTIVLLGDRAYKIKKPVKTDFLDFSSRELRLRACDREVRLNRRFAPDVYLGVSDVLDVDGDPCEHVVVMERMPPEQRLSQLVSRGEDLRPWLKTLAHSIARFHRQAARSKEIAAEGLPDAVAARWHAIATGTAPFAGSVLDPGKLTTITRMGHRYIEGRRSLFQERSEDERIRDCHGDLLADDIYCLSDGVRFLDCLEFEDRLRYVDVIDDAASLAMDLERCGAPAAGASFMDLFLREIGDGGPPSLVDFYIAYRAFMRARVACLRWQQGSAGARAQAARLLEIAGDHIHRAQVQVVLVGGEPGTGKTTLAHKLGAKPGWVTISTDETRKDLAGLAPQMSARSGYGSGIYVDAWTELTYGTVLERARRHLGAGRNVILDGTWGRSTHRELARQLARGTQSNLRELRCFAPAEVVRRRIAERRGGPSDADLEVSARIHATFDPWPEATEVDTSSVEEMQGLGARF